jgi:hypothetical protein
MQMVNVVEKNERKVKNNGPRKGKPKIFVRSSSLKPNDYFKKEKGMLSIMLNVPYSLNSNLFISHYSCAYQFVLQSGKCASSIGNVMLIGCGFSAVQRNHEFFF